jgi:hypothetical protein
VIGECEQLVVALRVAVRPELGPREIVLV